MATAADYVGKNCPYCGAIDSIETDEARGEAACVECATVVAMGLEENIATRFEKDATYADVDRENEHGWNPEGEGGGGMGRARARNAGLTREEAAAAAAGGHGGGSGAGAGGGGGGPFSSDAPYARTKLHPRMSGQLEALYRLSRRGDESILRDAIALAKHFVGFRRGRGIRVENQSEVSAACLMISAERLGQPIPLGELRVLDASLRDVETRRQEVIEAANLKEEMERLASKYVANLVHHYIQLLQLPLIRYEMPSLALFHAIRHVEGGGGGSAAEVSAVELATFVEAEKAVMAVLLARTDARLTWANKPPAPADPTTEPPRATVYASFASSAHLQPARVEKAMRVAERAVPLLQPEFERLLRTPEFATATIRAAGESAAAARPTAMGEASRKRSRSPSAP